MAFNLKPYSAIEDQDFRSEIVWDISEADVHNVRPVNNKILFPFINCKFRKLTIRNSDEINFPDVSIYFNSCFIQDIWVEEIATKNISINFGSSIVSGQIKNGNISSVELNNCIISQRFFLMDVPIINISYTEENIYPKKWLKLIKSLNTTYFDLLGQAQKFYIYRPQVFSFNMNEKSQEKRGFYWDKYNNKAELKYFLSQKEKDKLDIHLYFDFDKSEKQITLNIKNSFLRSLSLKKKAAGKINVENTKINSIYIHDSALNGEATFYKVSPSKVQKDNKIEVHKSVLKGFRFERVNFKFYDIVSFFRTDFEGAKFVTCDFPLKAADFERFKSLDNVHYPDLLPENYYKDQYEVFIQLKSILEKSGNFYEAQKLNAISNEALKKTNDIDWWDKQILWVNSWSNYHGLSIVKPLGWFLLISICFYILYLYSLGRIFNTNEIDLNLIGYYFSFIDITHRSDFLVGKEEFNGRMLAVDFVNKLLVGFFIYQFVAAFRKYGKK